MTVTRRSTVAVVSVILHISVLGALVLVSLLAPELLPTPHGLALAWQQPKQVQLVDIELEPEPRRSQQPSPALPAQSVIPPPTAFAPLLPPDGVMAETGREGTALATIDVPAAQTGLVPGTDIGHVEAISIPEPARREAVRLHSGIAAPRKVFDTAPVYPQIARTSHTQGVVILEATISESGEVISARVLRSVPLLDQAALDAVRQWRFEPARLNGKAIPVVMTVTVNFRLD